MSTYGRNASVTVTHVVLWVDTLCRRELVYWTGAGFSSASQADQLEQREVPTILWREHLPKIRNGGIEVRRRAQQCGQGLRLEIFSRMYELLIEQAELLEGVKDLQAVRRTGLALASAS